MGVSHEIHMYDICIYIYIYIFVYLFIYLFIYLFYPLTYGVQTSYDYQFTNSMPHLGSRTGTKKYLELAHV